MRKEFYTSLKKRLFKRTEETETPTEPEKPQPVKVGFFDLRDPQAAREANLEPGCYLSLFPISLNDMASANVLKTHLMEMLKVLSENESRPESDIKITVDTNGNTVDTNHAWSLSVFGYNPEHQILLVKASLIDQESAQTMIATSFQQGTAEIKMNPPQE